LGVFFLAEKEARNMPGLKTATITDMELFKVGTWNGITTSSQQLDDMIRDTNDIHERRLLKPRMLLGHGKQQLLQDQGWPVAGWMGKLKRVGDSVFATITDIPHLIAELVNAKAYGERSVEIEHNGEWGGKRYPRILKDVVFTGGKIPAVENLNDVRALYAKNDLTFPDGESENKQFTEICVLESCARGDGKGVGGDPQGDGGAKFCVCPECGSSIEHTDKGKPCIETKCAECGAKKEENVEDKEKVVELEKEKTELLAKVATAEQATKDAEAKEKTAKESLAKHAKDTEKEQIHTFVEMLSEKGKVFPADKEDVEENLLNRDNTEETKTYTIPDGESKGQEVKVTSRGLYMKKLSARKNIAKLNEELSLQTQEKNTPEVKDGADEESAELDTKVQEYMKAHPEVSYEEARKRGT
jgi:hypothetical protein